jgi:eukaryotic-like serine/threonine-protein kinase
MVQGRLPSRYRVIEEVGQGGMAVVYRAHDETLKREVAVKVLHAHLLAEPESKARLEREAQAVAKLQHDNIVQIFDYSGSESPASYIVTEFIDGQTLKQFMASRSVPAPEVAALIAIDVGSALLHAHSFGIIHRDVKPENVMVRRDGVLKLMDFGVAQIMDLERMTVTGQLLGSPAYMAPELLDGRALDVRTDVFSIGIMLYQLSTGALPFSGRNPHEVLKRIAEGRFADPRTVNRMIADRLAKIITRALARKPEERYATVAALLDDLNGFVGDAGLTSRRDELKAFFTDPEAYEKGLVPRMVAALVASGKNERAARRTARALELWNRALSMDPANKEVLGELKRLESRQHLVRGAWVVGAAGVLGVGAFVVLRTTAERQEARPVLATAPAKAIKPVTPATEPVFTATGPIPVATPAMGQKGAGAAASGGQGPSAAGSKPAGPPPRKSAARVTPPPAAPSSEASPTAAAPEAVPKRVFEIRPTPAAVAVYLDGVKQFNFGPGGRKIAIPWDREHILEVKHLHDCCASEERRLGPGLEEPVDDVIRVVLRGKPALLTIDTVPPTNGGKVRLDELNPEEGRKAWRATAELGEEVRVPFGDDVDMLKRLQITVDVDGRPTRLKQLEIQAGEKKTAKVPLDD